MATRRTPGCDAAAGFRPQGGDPKDLLSLAGERPGIAPRYESVINRGVARKHAHLPGDKTFQRGGRSGVAGFGDLARLKQGTAYAAVDTVRSDDEPARPIFAVLSGDLTPREVDRGNRCTRAKIGAG